MNRRTQGLLLAGSFAVATVVVLAVRFARGLDQHLCKIDFSPSISCTFKWSSTSVTTSTTQSSSLTPSTTQSSSHRRYQSGYVDVTSWAGTTYASVAAPAQAASDDREVELSEATGLPLPKRRVLTTAPFCARGLRSPALRRCWCSLSHTERLCKSNANGH